MLPSILFWLIIFPSSCKFHVTDASLTQFNLRSNNTLDYNLKVSITVRNPNNNIIVYYGRITSIAWYKDNDFSWVSLTPFGQCRKNTTFLQAVFEGKSVIKHKSKELGTYEIDVESSFSQIAHRVFDEERYDLWKVNMKSYMKSFDLWDAVKENYKMPSLPKHSTMAQIKYHNEKKTKKAKEKKVKTTDDLLSKEDWLSEPHSLSEASSSLSG
ncbi:NDR1/HIN1-like protein 10 [Glycine soja]|uniref:NDR1/HIN1-like protein 10 n=1 Tax=Glycine soja TaxID=3848 RepID=A0A445JUY6_GLYSO|nr:NDR1/HIN1-like protein 10 [Glycine soja]